MNSESTPIATHKKSSAFLNNIDDVILDLEFMKQLYIKKEAEVKKLNDKLDKAEDTIEHYHREFQQYNRIRSNALHLRKLIQDIQFATVVNPVLDFALRNSEAGLAVLNTNPYYYEPEDFPVNSSSVGCQAATCDDRDCPCTASDNGDGANTIDT